MASVLDHLRRRFVARRLELGLTQEQGAAFMGLDQGSMSKFERGHLGADVDALAALAAGYGTSLCEMLSDAPTTPTDPQWTRLWALFSALSVEGRAQLLGVLEEVGRVKTARTQQRAPQARRRRGGAPEKAAPEEQ